MIKASYCLKPLKPVWATCKLCLHSACKYQNIKLYSFYSIILKDRTRISPQYLQVTGLMLQQYTKLLHSRVSKCILTQIQISYVCRIGLKRWWQSRTAIFCNTAVLQPKGNSKSRNEIIQLKHIFPEVHLAMSSNGSLSHIWQKDFF